MTNNELDMMHSLAEVLVELKKWCELQMMQNSLIKSQIANLTERIEESEDAKPQTLWIKKPCGIVCSKCKSQAPFSPNGNQLESEFCPVCGSRKMKNDDPEIDKLDNLLTYYITTCSNCGKVSPVGNYCIWCGEKDTCLGDAEGGDNK